MENSLTLKNHLKEIRTEQKSIPQIQGFPCVCGIFLFIGFCDFLSVSNKLVTTFLCTKPGRKTKNPGRNVRDWFVVCLDQIALVTLPERIHRVQTYTWRGVPLIKAFTRLTLGFQGRLERR